MSDEDGDDLICGFGPRRGRGDSTDSSDVQMKNNNLRGGEARTRANQPPPIPQNVGFGGRDPADGGANRSGGNSSRGLAVRFGGGNDDRGTGTRATTNANASSRFSPNGPRPPPASVPRNIGGNGDDDDDDSRSSSGDIDIAALERNMTYVSGNNASTANGRGRQNRERRAPGNSSNPTFGATYTVSVPTKKDEYSISVPTKKDDSRPGLQRRDSGKSSSSGYSGLYSDDGEDMSMASEDAIVLMINMLEEEMDDSSGGGGGGRRMSRKEKKKKQQENVCGRVFKGQSFDYESIPMTLEIENDVPEGGWAATPAPNGRGAAKPGGGANSAAARGGGAPARKPGGGDAAAAYRPTSKGQDAKARPSSKREAREGRAGQASEGGSTKRVAIADGASDGGGNDEGRNARGRGKVAVSFDEGENNEGKTARGRGKVGVSFGPSVDRPPGDDGESGPSVSFSPASEQVQPRRRTSGGGGAEPNLGVIREDDASSASASADPKGSFVSVASSGTGDASSSSNAKSTAILWKADGAAEGGSAPAGPSKSPGRGRGPPRRGMLTKSKSKRTLQEEGRLAIVSRTSESAYVKKVVPKSESVKKLIHDAIATNILFKACSTTELDELVEVFAPSEASAGSTVVRQGDDGDAFYVMEQGTIDVYEGDAHKATLYSGTSFGEIALLYGCPRSATLRTRYSCKLWSISRSAFLAITRQFKRRRMMAKVEFLKKVKIKDKFLSDILSESEMNTLALASINESFEAGQVIVREGEPGDIFYMIDSGSVDVLIKAKGDIPVVTLTSGQFFGELALLSNSKRTASCVAKSDVECHLLMRDDFNLLLGDLQSLMDGGDYRRREAEGSAAQPKKASEASMKVDLSDLEILKVLGIGAFGRVRLAKLKRPRDDIKNDDGFFALKCISKQSLKENGLDSHISNEKAIMSSLDHPFINKYYCDMEDDEHLYFLLEALPGGELCKRLREEKKFPEPWGKFYSASVLFAFCHMHAKKMAYRDLKPENLVMDSVGYVKVVDFGLAKVIDGGKTWTLCGTPAYLAPEIVLNDGHDWAVDYWALGVFLFEMTSGKEPFAAKNPMEVYKQIVSGHVEIPSYFSSSLTDLILKLLNTSKSKRLGRTMGGGGTVMQHRWYSDFDWDAHLEKRLDVPLQPKTQEILCEDSVASDSRDSSALSSNNPSMSIQRKSQGKGNKDRPGKPPRMTYSLGQGNRHHQKLLEMMDNSVGDNNESEQQVDTVRMTMMRVIKQHERWSRTSKESSTSSTRNTSLGVGPGMSKTGTMRGSVNTESGASIASSGFGENLDAFLRLQLMHLSLASKRNSQNLETARAYQQFSLLSIDPASLTNERSELRDPGRRFLDPFVSKKVDLVDQFPSGLSESDIDAEALAAFCFPNGLRVRLIPRCAEEGAKRLGWLGENGDSYQLQGFTDVAGSLSHGCAITIRDELTHGDASIVSSAIYGLRERRRSAVVIARWWRHQSRRPERSHGARPMTKRANSMVEKTSSMKWGRKNSYFEGQSRAEDRNSAAGLRAAMDKVMSMNMSRSRRGKIKSASTGDLAYDESDASDEESFGVEYGEEEYLPPITENVRRLGLAAYQAMVDADKEGDICIVEKSYVITGTRLKDQSLFFCAMQNLIDMERKINDKAVRMTVSKRRSMVSQNNQQQGEGIQYSFDPANRQAVLSALQSKLSLTPLQRRISYPRNEMAHINNPQRHFVMDLSIMGFGKISLPLPLPEVSGQWGLATLFLRIKDSGLIILLKLLLLERSVLVVGETTEEVTACTTALLELLDPYKWASAFMPLLPRDMLDFVSSPVPFIAGMIVEGKQHLHSIIHDHGVKDSMLQGLSIVNLVSGKLIVTREQGTSDMLRRSFQTIPELSLYQKRLEEYCKSPSSNLRSFQSFFKHGASLKESLTLRKIKHVIKKHMAQFTVGLTDKPDAWQQYGEFNEGSGTFDFCPDKFIQPLKDRMIFQIQFQEMMAHTQLFVGYVEELQLAHEKRSDLLSGPSAQFIARWVELHWHARFSR